MREILKSGSVRGGAPHGGAIPLLDKHVNFTHDPSSYFEPFIFL
jgi:hypothetical protein